MLPDVSAVTAEREERRKFALREIKNKLVKMHGDGADKFMCLGRKACVPALQILIAQLPRRLAKFALNFSSNLRPINLTEP